MGKHLFKLILILVILGLAAGLLFVSNNLEKQMAIVSQAAPVVPIAIPTLIPESQITSQSSPDGRVTLTMKKQTEGDSTTFTFATQQGVLFTRNVNNRVTITIPFNTWSPDDKHVFVKEDTGITVNYWMYPGGINVTDYFADKLSDFKLTDITGWASDTLLVLNTNNSDGSLGPSFWFDITNNSFIRLSNRFN